jgi:hypothetical protein
MKTIFQILLLFLTWFINLVNATPVFTKLALPNYEFTFSKTENVKEEGVVKIGEQNFARSGIENENQFSSKTNGEVWVGVACSKENEKAIQGAGSLATHVDIQASLSTIANLKSTNKLTKAIGNASDIELGAIHKYTVDGGVLNTPMRNGSETVLGQVTFTEFQSQVYQSIKSGLVKLRQTNRLITGTVIRGRTYTLADFNTLFKSATTNVPLKGLVSCTKNEAVAVDFLTKSGANISGSKVKVIMKIKSKNGVDIDDMSDWGSNLVNQRHPGNLVQEEVLLEEGMFKMIGEPTLIKTEGGIPWYEVNLEELGTPLRTIN